jgi:hypothetical protein
MPASASTASNDAANCPSRSRTRNRNTTMLAAVDFSHVDSAVTLSVKVN